MWEIFKLSPIHASVIYHIPWINWIPVPLRENSNETQKENQWYDKKYVVKYIW